MKSFCVIRIIGFAVFFLFSIETIIQQPTWAMHAQAPAQKHSTVIDIDPPKFNFDHFIPTPPLKQSFTSTSSLSPTLAPIVGVFCQPSSSVDRQQEEPASTLLMTVSERLRRRREQMNKRFKEFKKAGDPILEAVKKAKKEQENAESQYNDRLKNLNIAQNILIGTNGLCTLISSVLLFNRCIFYASVPELAQADHASEHVRCFGDVLGGYIGPTLGVIATAGIGTAIVNLQAKKLQADKKAASELKNFDEILSKEYDHLKAKFTNYQKQNLDFFSLVEKYNSPILAQAIASPESSNSLPETKANAPQDQRNTADPGEVANPLFTLASDIQKTDPDFINTFNNLSSVAGLGTLSEVTYYLDASNEQVTALQYQGAVDIMTPENVKKALHKLLLSKKYLGTRGHILESVIAETVDLRKEIASSNLGKSKKEHTPQIKDHVCGNIFESPDSDEKWSIRDKFFTALSTVANEKGAESEIFREFDKITIPNEFKTTEDVGEALAQLAQKLDLTQVGELVFTELMETFPELFLVHAP